MFSGTSIKKNPADFFLNLFDTIQSASNDLFISLASESNQYSLSIC